MTQEEFGAMKFRAGMKALINGKEKDIVSVDFDQSLIGLEIEGDQENIDWVRIENLEIVSK